MHRKRENEFKLKQEVAVGKINLLSTKAEELKINCGEQTDTKTR